MRSRSRGGRSRRGGARRRSRVVVAAVLGLAAGGLAGLVLLAFAGVAIATRLGSGDREPGTLIEATHLPPLLTAPGEDFALRYDIYCASPGDDPEGGAPCDGGGTVYVRAGQSGPFEPIPLRFDPNASEGRYVARVPEAIATAREGFSYYAVVRNNRSGASATLPSGGASAPQRSLPLDRPVTVRLGVHGFGSARAPDARVARASWGNESNQAGLEPGREMQPIGASSFDVDATGAVLVLDEAHRRVLRFGAGMVGPTAVPVDVRGTIADLAVGTDGAMAVLETVGDNGEPPLVRTFRADGAELGAWPVAEESASSIKPDPDGFLALQYPAGQWMPVVERGVGLDRATQRRKGDSGRRVAGGEEIIAQREGDEARISLVGPNGVRRSWRVVSDTPLGEIQLAEPLGNRVVVVLRVYTDSRDEFQAIVLDGRGVERQFAIDSTAWAETAPLGRLRLHGSSLYGLGSTPQGMYVDRYDLEVTR